MTVTPVFSSRSLTTFFRSDTMAQDWLVRAKAVCVRCGGQCCIGSRPPLSERCYHRMLAKGVPDDAFERNGYRHIRTRADGSCLFRDNGKCGIHTIKPETCRAGPFTFDVRGDRIDIFLKLRKICPLVGLLEDVPEAYDQQYATAVRIITRLVSNLTDEELAAICRIEEPDTEKIAEIPRIYHESHDHRH